MERGKHIHLLKELRHFDGRWVYGYLSDEKHIHSPELEGEFLVDPETVCQYIGMHDNTKWEQLSESEQNRFLQEWNVLENRWNTKEDWRGRKIFEGDIVKHFNRPEDGEKYVIGCIKWDQDSCKFIKEKKDGAKYSINNKCIYEVIGNIFDNPELLEVENEVD